MSRGGTGALIIGDVGQNAYEEIDYEPRGRGGRNYGWRVRGGSHVNIASPPPAGTRGRALDSALVEGQGRTSVAMMGVSATGTMTEALALIASDVAVTIDGRRR